jgi:hypothetical protein
MKSRLSIVFVFFAGSYYELNCFRNLTQIKCFGKQIIE